MFVCSARNLLARYLFGRIKFVTKICFKLHLLTSCVRGKAESSDTRNTSGKCNSNDSDMHLASSLPAQPDPINQSNQTFPQQLTPKYLMPHSILKDSSSKQFVGYFTVIFKYTKFNLFSILLEWEKKLC